jgi:hypothetical protein
MKDQERRLHRVLWAYPAAYRAKKGSEIIGTVLDAADARGRVHRRDLVDLVVHGIRMRLGLSADRFGGRVMDAAGLPGLFMGAGLSVFLFVWGEWLPITRTPYSIARFGPFLTVGPIIYLAWIVSAVVVTVQPRLLRLSATICVTITAVMWPIGKLAFASPNFWQLLLLFGFGLPGVLAPSSVTDRRRIPSSLVAGVGTFAVIWWLGAVHYLNPPFFNGSLQWSFYLFGNYLTAGNLPWLEAAVFLSVIGLLATHQSERAGALVVLSAPMLALVAGSLRGADAVSVRHRGGFVAFGTSALLISIAWLVMAWSTDVRSKAGDRVDIDTVP